MATRATREYQDPRLLKRLEFGDPEEHLPALFIANREEGHAIVARLQQMLKEEPRQVHHLPRYSSWRHVGLYAPLLLTPRLTLLHHLIKNYVQAAEKLNTA